MTSSTVLTARQRQDLVSLAEDIRVNAPAVAFTGAGISTESGIPDYRGPNGLWKRTKPTTFKQFLKDPSLRTAHWERRRTRYPVLAAAEPNAGHHALRRLQSAGFLGTIITQNIDGLHQKAGSDSSSIIELHGSAHHIRCLNCRTLFKDSEFPFPDDGSEPSCPRCGGIVKEATIAFGESLDANDLRRALETARTADLMLVVGSSLRVNPAAKVPQLTVQSGGRLAIINNEPTPMDLVADHVIHAPAGPALSHLADLLTS